ncbi:MULTISPECIES: NAD-dependent epimerase/dehydratase family protein [unclassified Wenzhouxiangella]|uniref:NAD-dependent epimerase/dehydratase family protein n=1 Tax=unclassified Wenzhouxiangella TaxID=2613841 RepID=UPI000E32A0AC|nr:MULTISPECIES: NAD-dependent epimerase/dehydratase family protein [unclassified Wenzhouxiangella]RFF27864.1 NAD-dependent epimerase/dehydratase family protein [Wenzhouxiangella sp. 15181]RFP69009.1 NAD-dependent epimerase/dehydratase family protein [Wenzhouxiangella sp. 15190]
MKWLVTGGCGFIGTSLIRHLITEGNHSITVLDNLTTGTREDLSNVCDFDEIPREALLSAYRSGDSCNLALDRRCKLIAGDILDQELAHAVSRDADIIVHLAANTGVGRSVEDPRLDCHTNVIGTFNYLEAARQNKVSRFVFASSGAPIGEVEPPIHEELAPHPASPYGASKLAGEGYCSAYKHSFGLDTVILRFGNVYGPGSLHKGSVVAKFIRRAMNSQPLEIFGDGTQTRDFIYIEDLIEAVLKAATKQGIGGEIFQIATNRETTVGEMTEYLVRIMQSRGIQGIKLRNAERPPGDVRRNFSDTSKARRLLNWQSKTHLEAGLERTVDYFLQP